MKVGDSVCHQEFGYGAVVSALSIDTHCIVRFAHDVHVVAVRNLIMSAPELPDYASYYDAITS